MPTRAGGIVLRWLSCLQITRSHRSRTVRDSLWGARCKRASTCLAFSATSLVAMSASKRFCTGVLGRQHSPQRVANCLQKILFAAAAAATIWGTRKAETGSQRRERFVRLAIDRGRARRVSGAQGIAAAGRVCACGPTRRQPGAGDCRCGSRAGPAGRGRCDSSGVRRSQR